MNLLCIKDVFVMTVDDVALASFDSSEPITQRALTCHPLGVPFHRSSLLSHLRKCVLSIIYTRKTPQITLHSKTEKTTHTTNLRIYNSFPNDVQNTDGNKHPWLSSLLQMY